MIGKITFNGIRPPSNNYMYQKKYGKDHKTSPRKQFNNAVKELCKGLDIDCTDKEICMMIYFEFKGKREIDLDNVARALINALEGTIYKNDRQIYKLILEKRINCKENKIDVMWEEIKEEEDTVIINHNLVQIGKPEED
jgi:Holliday junction resolvase RusA-like endonuclease